MQLPKVQLPKVNLPKIPNLSQAANLASRAATAALPKISLPKMPTFKTPQVSIPKISLPSLAAAAAVPSLAIPLAVGSSLSQFSLPKVPTFKTPQVSIPKISLSSLAAAAAVPSLAVPLAIGSSLSQMGLPKVPQISMPNLPGIDLSGVSAGVDSIIGARDKAYDQGGTDIGEGNFVKGGTEFAGAAAADILLPLDLVNVSNKALTGRMDEISGEDAIFAALDAVSILAIPLTGGASYALVRAAKGGKLLSASAKVGKSMSLVSGLKSAFKGIKGAGSLSGGAKMYSSVAPTVRTVTKNSRTYSSAVTALKSPRTLLKKTSLLTSAKTPIKTYPQALKASNPLTGTKVLDDGKVFKSADGVTAAKVSESAKVADSTAALGHTGGAATKSGLWWKVGAAGLGASVLGSFLMGEGTAETR